MHETNLQSAAAAPVRSRGSLEPYVEKIPGTLVEFRMMPVSGGSVTVKTPSGKKEVDVDPFWMGETEVTWDSYDIFVYGLDEKRGQGGGKTDAIARPSDPYVIPGQGFGHKGYPALALTLHAARQYARWLSIKTGTEYHVPTGAQWIHACCAGLPGGSASKQSSLGEHAWHQGNADGKVHPVGSLKPNDLGLYDMRGNVAEWTYDGEGGPHIVRGGSYKSTASEVGCHARMEQTPAWQATDPQLPKSQWWLSDAPFVGFRIARVP